MGQPAGAYREVWVGVAVVMEVAVTSVGCEVVGSEVVGVEETVEVAMEGEAVLLEASLEMKVRVKM